MAREQKLKYSPRSLARPPRFNKTDTAVCDLIQLDDDGGSGRGLPHLKLN